MIAHYVIILLVMLGVLYWAAPSPDEATAPASAITQLPALEIPQPDGSIAGLEAYRGKLVLIHFWASWCPPCLPELPELVAAAKNHPDDLVILSYSLDKSAELMADYYATNFPDLPPNFITLWDKDGALAREQFLSLRYPETFIIGCNGKLAEKITGAGKSWERIVQRHGAECGD